VMTAIISARQAPSVARRAADLGINYLHQGSHDKRATFEQLLKETGLTADACGFIGDDIIDLPILSRAGFAASVPNGHPDVQARVHYVSKAAGGRGAVREICDFILRAQNKYDSILAAYLT
jgi:3-deoxy-D-manno-octulosonate 8-phosphate phosphatase (KDO 8-P phosphatase)